MLADNGAIVETLRNRNQNSQSILKKINDEKKQFALKTFCSQS